MAITVKLLSHISTVAQEQELFKNVPEDRKDRSPTQAAQCDPALICLPRGVIKDRTEQSEQDQANDLEQSARGNYHDQWPFGLLACYNTYRRVLAE